MFKSVQFLVLGDILAILIVTVIGFATHGEADLSFLPRMASAFFPVTIAWFILAPFLGLFQPEITMNPKQLWRPVFAMIFAAPLATILRGFLLNAPIIPIFAVVIQTLHAAKPDAVEFVPMEIPQRLFPPAYQEGQPWGTVFYSCLVHNFLQEIMEGGETNQSNFAQSARVQEIINAVALSRCPMASNRFQ